MATIHITEELSESLARLAEEHQTSAEEYVQRQLSKLVAREKFYRDGADALKHYRETGLHLTGEEATEWFSRMKAGDESDPPCHK